MPRMDADGSATENGCARGGGRCADGGNDRSADSCLGELKIGYAYVPIQKFRMLYSAADALSHGTLFEELYLPREVY